MKVSIIIPTRDRSEDLKKALESIVKQSRPPEEVVVVDQSSDMRTKTLVKWFEGTASHILFIYTHREENGTAKARNNGIGHASGEIVTFLDDDVVLEPDYFNKVTSFFESHPEVGGLSGNARTDYFPSGVRWAVRKVLQKLFLINFHNGRMTPSGFGFPIVDRLIECPLEVEMLPGCNMSVRGSFLKKVHFDEWFTGYSYREDVDFSYQLSRVTKLMMIPEARLYHSYASANRLSATDYKAMEIKNSHYVFRKCKPHNFWSDTLFIYSLVGLTFLEFIEFLSGFKKDRLRKFLTNISTSWEVMTHGD